MLSLSSLAQSVTISPSGITPAPVGNMPSLTYDAIEALPSPSMGSMVIDITFNCLRFYNGKKWAKILSDQDLNIPSILAWNDGGEDTEEGLDIAVDASGNIYITGDFYGTATFGNTSITSNGGADIFVAKYNKSGSLIWVKKAGGTGSDYGENIAVDGNGNIYVTGRFKNTTTIGAITLISAGVDDVFTAKYTNSGEVEWAQKAGGNSNDEITGMVADIIGNVYITGNFKNSVFFGNTTIVSAGDKDIFIAKYDSGGILQWVEKAGGVSEDSSQGITIDANENVYITGYFYNISNFGNYSVTSAGSSDIFTAKYNPLNDKWIWVNRAGGPSGDYGGDIVTNSKGEVLISGNFSGTASFSGAFITSAGESDMFIVKYFSTGTLGGLKREGGIKDESPRRMAIDANDNIYITGVFTGVSNLGSFSLASQGSADIFIAKFNAMGILEWARSAGGVITDYVEGIAVEANGNVYITGHFYEQANFGNVSLSGVDNDVFIARIRD